MQIQKELWKFWIVRTYLGDVIHMMLMQIALRNGTNSLQSLREQAHERQGQWREAVSLLTLGHTHTAAVRVRVGLRRGQQRGRGGRVGCGEGERGAHADAGADDSEREEMMRYDEEINICEYGNARKWNETILEYICMH